MYDVSIKKSNNLVIFDTKSSLRSTVAAATSIYYIVEASLKLNTNSISGFFLSYGLYMKDKYINITESIETLNPTIQINMCQQLGNISNQQIELIM